MSDNKKNVFLTEASTLDDRKKTDLNERDGSSMSNDLSDNDEDISEKDDEQEDDDDEEFDTNGYQNPFSQPYILPQKKSSARENIEIRNLSSIGDQRPISALAPKTLQNDDTQIEISSTPAFQFLEEVCYQ